MKLTSNNFQQQEDIPNKFTCDDDDVSPHLSWDEFPEETKSFALTCIDPDAPGGGFIHWLMANIPVESTVFNENCDCPPEADEIKNDFGMNEYGGPCPPSGKHRYIFTIYALSIERLEGLNKDNFFETIKGYTLDSAELVGVYKRS
ncbi:YbhB/YbcL family Raf kinase inhibitor-like protein [Patescibacteria group bacterium]|nr:YbhB/YbcL family Raf kinase inhibitor-like protein [Patescibacteria group bacterium]MBU1890679.1 YbhB/YbcL family Raf kinase inhibitor-like protein [Patescibacteria group bacterium]